jgi:hypothetical protein
VRDLELAFLRQQRLGAGVLFLNGIFEDARVFLIPLLPSRCFGVEALPGKSL